MQDAVLAVSDGALVKECHAILRSASQARQHEGIKTAEHYRKKVSAVQMATDDHQREPAGADTGAVAQSPTLAESAQVVSEAGLTSIPEERVQAMVALNPGDAGDDFMSNMMADLLA